MFLLEQPVQLKCRQIAVSVEEPINFLRWFVLSERICSVVSRQRTRPELPPASVLAVKWNGWYLGFKRKTVVSGLTKKAGNIFALSTSGFVSYMYVVMCVRVCVCNMFLLLLNRLFLFVFLYVDVYVYVYVWSLFACSYVYACVWSKTLS